MKRSLIIAGIVTLTVGLLASQAFAYTFICDFGLVLVCM